MKKIIYALSGGYFLFHLLFWGVIIGTVVTFWPDIVDFMNGVGARFDHIIGYSGDGS